MITRTVRFNLNPINKLNIKENVMHFFTFITLWLFIVITLFMMNISNIFKSYFKITEYVYMKCIYYFSKSLDYFEEQKYFDPSSRRLINDRANKEPYLVRYYMLFTDRDKFPLRVFVGL